MEQPVNLVPAGLSTGDYTMRRFLSFVAIAALTVGALGLGASQANAQVIVSPSGIAPVSYYYPSYYPTYTYNYATYPTPLGYQYQYNYWVSPGYSYGYYNPAVAPAYIPSSAWYWNRYAPAFRRSYWGGRYWW
jgi:hypothetical protein